MEQPRGHLWTPQGCLDLEESLWTAESWQVQVPQFQSFSVQPFLYEHSHLALHTAWEETHLRQLRDWSRGQQRLGSTGSSEGSRAFAWSEIPGESLRRFRGIFCPNHKPWCIGQFRCGPSVYQLQSLMFCMCTPLRHSFSRASPAHTVCHPMTRRMSTSHGSVAHTLFLQECLAEREKMQGQRSSKFSCSS